MTQPLDYTGKVTYRKGKDGQWYWRLKAPNGEIVSPSEGYSSKAAARKGSNAAQRAFVNPERPKGDTDG